MNKKTIYAILILIALAVIPVYWMQLAFHKVIIRDSLYLSSVFAAVAGGLYAMKKYGVKQARGLTLILLTTGISLLLVGELIFEYYFIVLKHDIPFPSFADIAYLLSYPMLLGGFYNEIRLADVNYRKLNKAIWAVLLVIALILAYVVYRWGIVAAYDPKETLFTNIIAMSYSVGDLFLILATLFLTLLVREYRGGKFASIWLFMMAGFTMLLAGDIFSEFFRTQYHDEVWFWKCFLDSLGMAGYLCYATALFKFGFSIDEAVKGVKNIVSSTNLKPIELKSNDLQENKAPVVEPAANPQN